MHNIELLGGQLTIDSEWLLSMCQPGDKDAVLLSGTMVEGIGNLSSDLDVYILCKMLPRRSDFSRPDLYTEFLDDRGVLIPSCEIHASVHALYFFHPHLNLHIDAKFLTHDKIVDVFTRIHSLYATLLQDDNIFYTTNPIDFNYEDSQLIHRFLNSQCLLGYELYSLLLQNIPLHEYRCAVYCDLALDHPSLLDLRGFLDSSDLLLAAEVARNLLLRHTHALLVSLGVTNRNPKWVMKYIHVLPIAVAQNLVEIISSPTLTNEDKLSFVKKVINYLDNSLECVRLDPRSHKMFHTFTEMAPVIKRGLIRRQQKHNISVDAYNIRTWVLGFGSAMTVSNFIFYSKST